MPDVIPTRVKLRLIREKDHKLRITIYENGAPADLTGDTVQLIAKDEPGGTVKFTGSCTLEPQTGTTLGQCTVIVTKVNLRADGYPNVSPVLPVTWVYQVVRTHAGLETAPLEGDLELGPTI